MQRPSCPNGVDTGLAARAAARLTLILNLRLRAARPRASRWLAELYVTNLTDKNAIIYTSTGNFDLRQTTNEPRVYGLRVNYRFGQVNNSE